MEKKNQTGNVMILPLPLVIFIALIAGTFISWLDFHARLRARDRALEEAAQLSTSLKMTFSNRAACKQNLSAAGFGTTLASLGVTKKLSILNTHFSGISPGILLSSGQHFQGILISDVGFSLPRKIPAPESSYIADLVVAYRDPLTKMDRQFTLPFYFTTDSTGTNLVNCMASSYIQPNSQITMEDKICMIQQGGPDYIYLPQQQTCVLKI